MLKTIIFDLDGTLLPMDQDAFLQGYFKLIMAKFPEYNLEVFIKALNYGIMGMVTNDGKMINEERFWDCFQQIHPIDDIIPNRFVEFYNHDFQSLIKYTNPTPLASSVIKTLKNKGYQLLCCTNPLFPQVATFSRIKWAGLNPSDFSLVTTFENSTYAKPNLKYYEEVINLHVLDPQTCLMVGNDVYEDMQVRKFGMKTFLLEDNLINSKNIPIEVDYRGNFNELLTFVTNLEER